MGTGFGQDRAQSKIGGHCEGETNSRDRGGRVALHRRGGERAEPRAGQRRAAGRDGAIVDRDRASGRGSKAGNEKGASSPSLAPRPPLPASVLPGAAAALLVPSVAARPALSSSMAPLWP